eukprot:g15125.t1
MPIWRRRISDVACNISDHGKAKALVTVKHKALSPDICSDIVLSKGNAVPGCWSYVGLSAEQYLYWNSIMGINDPDVGIVVDSISFEFLHQYLTFMKVCIVGVLQIFVELAYLLYTSFKMLCIIAGLHYLAEFSLKKRENKNLKSLVRSVGVNTMTCEMVQIHDIESLCASDQTITNEEKMGFFEKAANEMPRSVRHDLELNPQFAQCVDSHGWSALHYCAAFNNKRNLDTMKVLLEYIPPEEINRKTTAILSHGETAVDVAYRLNKSNMRNSIIKLLRWKGGKANWRDEKGNNVGLFGTGELGKSMKTERGKYENEHGLQIFIRRGSGKSKRIDAAPTDMVRDIKAKYTAATDALGKPIFPVTAQNVEDNTDKYTGTNDGSTSILTAKTVTVEDNKACSTPSVSAVPISAIRLSYNGKELDDNRTLSDYNIQNYSTLEASFGGLNGGMSVTRAASTTVGALCSSITTFLEVNANFLWSSAPSVLAFVASPAGMVIILALVTGSWSGYIIGVHLDNLIGYNCPLLIKVFIGILGGLICGLSSSIIYANYFFGMVVEATKWGALKFWFHAIFIYTRNKTNQEPGSAPNKALTKVTEAEVEGILQDTFVAQEGAKKKLREIIAAPFLDKLRGSGTGGCKTFKHYVFQGPPGTGKTSFAKFLCEILWSFDCLESNRFRIVNRENLVGTHVGHTEDITGKVLDSVRGGALIVDEAHKLTDVGGMGIDFGRIALSVLMNAMTLNQCTIILVGYTTEMQRLLNADDGLKRRINNIITFINYSVEELVEIFLVKIKTMRINGHSYNLGFNSHVLNRHIEKTSEVVRNLFNGGLATKVLKNAVSKLNIRLKEEFSDSMPSREQLHTITEDDIGAAFQDLRTQYER